MHGEVISAGRRFLPHFRPSALLLFCASVLLLCSVAAGDRLVLTRDRLYDAVFVGPKEAWVVGYPGLVLHTKDGGASFERAKVDTTDAVFAVTFADASRGWIAGRSGMIFSTTDGGKTWTKQETGTSEHFFDVAFADEKTGIAVGSFGNMARTSDGGAHWTVSTFEQMANAAINAVCFSSGRRAWIAGEYPSWEAQLEEDVSAASLGNLFYSDDGGATWTKKDPGATNTLNDVIFAGPGEGFAAGSKGTLLRTQDSGSTWARVPVLAKAHFFKLANKGGEVWAAGADGTLLRVTRAGAQKVDIGHVPWLSGLAFSPDGFAGALVGGRGTMRYTADAGASWLEPKGR
jgi:photosystem II stability/assembly factor-like uncharacterized protein